MRAVSFPKVSGSLDWGLLSGKGWEGLVDVKPSASPQGTWRGVLELSHPGVYSHHLKVCKGH